MHKFTPVTAVLAAEKVAGHDMPLASGLNLLSEDEQEDGNGLYLLRHPEHGTALLWADGRSAPDYRLLAGYGAVLAVGTWEQVLPALRDGSIAVPAE